MGESYLSHYYMYLLGREIRSYNGEYFMFFYPKKGVFEVGKVMSY